MNTSKNCNSELLGAYCSSCGQRASIDKITFKETLTDIGDNFFSINAPFFRTLTQLFANPGTLFREYLSGKRKKYYKPVSFFILLTIIYLALRGIIDFDPFSNSTLSVRDETERQLLLEARNYFLLHIDKLLFVFVFTLGVFLKLFFYQKQAFVEFLAISFYQAGVYTLFVTINMFFMHYINITVQFLAIVLMCFYFIYTMVSFFHKNKILVALKSLIIYIVSFFSYAMLSFGISYLIVHLKST